MGVCAKVRQGQGPAVRREGAPGGRQEGRGLRALPRRAPDVAEAVGLRRHRRGALRLHLQEHAGRLLAMDERREPPAAHDGQGPGGLLPARSSAIAGALEWAYREHGILHRDLKPENILIDDLERAAVSDWGIAGGRDDVDPAAADGPMVIYGTAAYASPEQLLGGVPLDVRSDIYSLSLPHVRVGDRARALHGRLARDPRGEDPQRRLRASRPGCSAAPSSARTTSSCAGLERERHGRYPDWKSFTTDVLNASLRRELKIGRFVPKMRYQASEVRSEVLRAKVATGALVTGRGGAAVDVRGAKKDLDEALHLAEREDWRRRGRDPLPRRPPDRRPRAPGRPAAADVRAHARARLLKLDRPAEAVAALDALSAATDKPSDMFALLADAHLRLGNAALAERAARTGPPPPQDGSGPPRPPPRRAGRAGPRVRRGRDGAPAHGGTARRRDARWTPPSSSCATPRPCPRRASPSTSRSCTRRSSLATEARTLAPKDVRPRVVRARALQRLDRWAEAKAELAGFAEGGEATWRREAAEAEARSLLRLKEYAGVPRPLQQGARGVSRTARASRGRAPSRSRRASSSASRPGGRRVVDDAAMSFFERAVADAAVRERRRLRDARALPRVDGPRRGGRRGPPARAGRRSRSPGRSASPSRGSSSAAAISRSRSRSPRRRRASAPFRPEAWRALAAVKGVLGPEGRGGRGAAEGAPRPRSASRSCARSPS